MHELSNPDNPDVRIATAQWTAPEKVGEILADKANGIFCGRDAAGNSLTYYGGGAVMVIAAPRSGKGSCIEIPTMVRRGRSSLWSFSTRGDVASVVAPRRGHGIPGVCDGIGQRVVVADPGRICDVPEEMRVRYNILTGMLKASDPECIAAASRISTAIMPIPNGGDQYFAKDGRPCLTGLQLHVLTAPIFENRRNLFTCYELAVNGDLATWREMRNRGLIQDETPHEVLWESMKQNPFFHGKIARDGGYYLDMLDVAAKQWKGVQGEVRVAMAFLDDPGVRETICGDDDFDMASLKTDPDGVSFFHALRDDRVETDFAFPRLNWEWLAWTAKRVPGPPASGGSILTWIDEMASLRKIDSLQQGIAQLAGNFLQLAFNLQSLGQLREVYGEHGMAVFKAGCPCQIFLDLGHDDYTAEYIQKSCGDVEIKTRDRSHSVTRGTNQSRTLGESVQVNYGVSHGESDSYSTQSGTSGQLGGSAGTHTGYSRGQNFGGSLLNIIRPLCFRPEWKTNTGVSGGQNSQKSWGSGWNEGVTDQRGQSKQANVGVSVGVNSSITEGTSYSETDGWAEHRHKRPLIAINDALNEFVRIRDRNDPRFPGLALVRIPGCGPMIVRREDYFNSPLCYRKFGKDPEYDFSQAPKPADLVALEDTVRIAIATEADKRAMSKAISRVRIPVFLPFDRVRSMLRPGEKLTFPYSKRYGRRAHLRGVVLEPGEPLIGSERLNAVLRNPLACVPELLLWNVDNPSGANERGIYCSLRPADLDDFERLLTQRMKDSGQRLDLAIKATVASLVRETETPLVEYGQALADVELMTRRIAAVQWKEPLRYAGPVATVAGVGISLVAGFPAIALGFGLGFAWVVAHAVDFDYEERHYNIARQAFGKLFKRGEADL